MKLQDEQWAFVNDVASLILYIHTHGFTASFGEVYRTPEQHAIYQLAGKTKSYFSQHQKRLAVDLNFFVNGLPETDIKILGPIGRYWESLYIGNKAGMFWKFYDPAHFERRTNKEHGEEDTVV